MLTSTSLKLRLTDVIDVLHSSRGAALVDRLEARLHDAGAAVRAYGIGPELTATAPNDAFDGSVARALFSNFMFGTDVKAALPNAVTRVIARASDANGIVDLDRVGALFGPSAKALMLQINELATSEGKPIGTTRRHVKYAWMPDDVLSRIARSADTRDLASRMPVLFELARAIAGPQTFADFRLYAVQHLFGTTRVLFELLEACGLPRELAITLGKNYSTDPDALYALRADGWNAPELGMDHLTVHEDDGTDREIGVVAQYLATMFENVDPSLPDAPRFLLLDDGGKMVDALHRDPKLRPFAKLCTVVEQTERGMCLVDKLQADGIALECTVVDAARSWLKKQFESAMIGESIAHAIDKSFQELGIQVEPRQATVVGYGAVGKATADALRRRDYQVTVIDTDVDKHAAIIADGYGFDAKRVATREEALSRAQLYVSATGYTTIEESDYAMLPNGAVLANAASGNHELGSHTVEPLQGSVRDDPRAWRDDYAMGRTVFKDREIVLGDLAGAQQTRHRVVRSADGTEERLVLRSGYVVNLTEDIPPEFIQLTRALLFAALVQATTVTGAGVVPVADDLQRFIHTRVATLLRKLGKSLEEPDFRGL